MISSLAKAASMAVGVCILMMTQDVNAFLQPTQIITKHHAISTSLSMGKRKKPSMKERRKQRAKKQPGFTVERGLLDELPPVDTWEKTQPTAGVKREAAAEAASVGSSEESEETKAKASSLVESQRKSVDSLTFIRSRVEEVFPINAAAKSIAEQGYFVHDGFLASGEDEAFGDVLLSEMFQECSEMLSNDKLERDISRLGDGEFIGKIQGGEFYADCPRLTEFVVSLTRHLPPLLNKEMNDLDAGDVAKLDAAASMGTLRLYDRKTRVGAETLFMKPETDETLDRPFGVICGDSEGAENDTRRLTAMIFLSSDEWDPSSCGGGVSIENHETIGAKRDRIVLLRSDTCSHRQEPWKGDDKEGLEQASCVVVHLVKETGN